VEKYPVLGGTAVNAWVETWIEGIHPPYFVSLFNRLKSYKMAAGDLDKSILPPRYTKGANQNDSYGLRLVGTALAKLYAADMATNKRFTIMTEYELINVLSKNGNVSSVTVVGNGSQADNVCTISAQFFIDSSGDGTLCRKAGCDAFVGEDAFELYNESLMKNKTPQAKTINEPSLFFKVSERGTPSSDTGNDFNYDGYRNPNFCWVNPMTGFNIPGIDVINEKIDNVYKKNVSRIGAFWNYIKE
jgi:hypothetical protein